MSQHGLWKRIKKARLFRVLSLYAGASWVVLQLVGFFIDSMGLPRWSLAGTIVLLVIGLLIILATAWVQAHPLVEAREEAEEVPGTWEMALADLAESVTRGELPHLTWARSLLAGAVAFLLLFGFAGLYVVIQDRGRSFAPTEAHAGVARPGLAVLPFSVRGSELREWREGMVDLLSVGLDGAAGVRAVDSRTVLARWDEIVGAERADREESLEVARAAGARWAVLGTAVGIGSDVRLVADVYSAEDGRKLGQAQVEGTPDEMHDLVDRLAIEVLDVLVEGDVTDLPRIDLASVTTSSVPALKAFLAGEVRLRRSDFPGAVDAYRRAVEEDSLFAYAHLRLAEALGWQAGPSGAGVADRHRRRAVELASRLPERQRFVARSAHRLRAERDPAAVDSLREATERYPDDPSTWYALGEAYVHFNQVAAPPASLQEAIRPFRRAVALDPGFAPYHIHLVELQLYQVDPDSAQVAASVAELAAASGDDRISRASSLAFELAFSDSATRRAAWAAVDTGASRLLPTLVDRLQGAAFVELKGRVIERLLEVLPKDPGPVARADLVRSLALGQGRLDSALAVLEVMPDPGARGPVPGGGGPCVLFTLAANGAPLPPEAVDAHLSPAPGDASAPAEVAACKALFAMLRGRWARADSLVESYLDALERTGRIAGVSPGAEGRDASLMAFDAFRRWNRDGATEEALEAMEAARRATGGIPNATLGRLYRDAGRLEDALDYYLADWTQPLSHREAGLILARLGRAGEARKYLRSFLRAWDGADPEMEPLVEEAREALEAL